MLRRIGKYFVEARVTDASRRGIVAVTQCASRGTVIMSTPGLNIIFIAPTTSRNKVQNAGREAINHCRLLVR